MEKVNNNNGYNSNKNKNNRKYNNFNHIKENRQSSKDKYYEELRNIKQKNNKDFASIGEMMRSTTKKSANSKYTREDLQTYLSDHYRYHTELRRISDWLYVQNGIYKNIINAFHNLPTLDNIILPSSKTLNKMDDKSYDVYFDKVNNYLDTIELIPTTRNILKSVAKYGVFIGYERQLGNEYSIQPLPIDFCRIKYKVGNEYQLEFNFKYFDSFYDKEDLDFAFNLYPQEFKKLYNRFKSDKKSRNPEWQMIDMTKTFCICSDDDEAYFVPMYTGMFDSLISNEEYKDLIKKGEELNILKLIFQQVPTDTDGNILMSSDVVRTFHERLISILPEGADAFTSPMKIEDVNFKNPNQQREELLRSAERAVYTSSGYNSAIFAESGSHTGLQANIEFVTANIYSILEKIEMAFNRKLKKIANSKNYEFKLKFFRTTNININETFERGYKLLSIGGAIQPIFSLSGFDADTYNTLLHVENKLGIKDNLIVPQSMHTQGKNGDGDTKSEKGGRSEKEEKELKDGGQTARALDSNNKE